MEALHLGCLALGISVLLAAEPALAESCAQSSDTCPPSAERPGFGSSLLQSTFSARRQVRNFASRPESPIEKVLSGVPVTIHTGLDFGRVYLPEELHSWAIMLPEACTDKDVESFAEGLPEGAKSLFLGTPSESGLCMLGMEATEAQLLAHLIAKPGALSAELDLKIEEELQALRKAAGLSQGGAAAPVPPQEGFPPIASLRAAERSAGRPPSGTPIIPRQKFAMQRALDVDVPHAQLGDPGERCGGPHRVNVYFPVPEAGEAGRVAPAKRRRPIVSVGHGYMQGGNFVDKQLAEGLIRPIVERGYFVVAHQSGADWCDSSEVLLRSITWLAQESAFKDEVDANRTALVGYSMGGLFALKAAAEKRNVNAYNITAVVALMPPCQSGCVSPMAPTFFGTGTEDQYCPHELVEKAYHAQQLEPKVLVDIPGAPHHEVGLWGRNRHMKPLINFLDCHLTEDVLACEELYLNENITSTSIPSQVRDSLERAVRARVVPP
mmetsp:Transcript_51426/g.137563  ORF Transcript_51426/g.137563 Transcript_51426/m.137563 type:complete len:495 (-) Transcript_51426:77-1561(-)